MSKLLFGCGAWPPLGVGDRQRFSGAVFSLYRATLGLQVSDSQHLTLATICSLLSLLDYASLLRVEQLQYLRQLCATAPDALWALHLQLLREALHWLFVRVKATCHLADPAVAFEEWRVLICDRPSLFKGLIRRAKGLELCRLTCYAAMQAVHVLKQASQGADLPDIEAGASCVKPVLFAGVDFLAGQRGLATHPKSMATGLLPPFSAEGKISPCAKVVASSLPARGGYADTFCIRSAVVPVGAPSAGSCTDASTTQ